MLVASIGSAPTIEATSIADSLASLADLGPTVTVVSLIAAAWTVGTLAGACVGEGIAVERSRAA